MWEDLGTAFAGKRVQACSRLLARQPECQGCLVRDKTIAGAICFHWTGGERKVL